jgi:hypothetical protein
MDYDEYQKLRSHLSAVIGTAIMMLPKKVRKDFAEKATGLSDPACRAMAQAAAEEVIRSYHLTRRELQGEGHGAVGFSPPKP